MQVQVNLLTCCENNFVGLKSILKLSSNLSLNSKLGILSFFHSFKNLIFLDNVILYMGHFMRDL